MALSELWGHHRSRHYAPSPVGSERSCKIEAALVGSPSHVFRHVKKERYCRVSLSDEEAVHFRREDLRARARVVNLT